MIILERNKIYCGNCLEIMPQIPDKSIDMILCDLPYGTTACKWDQVIPFEPLWAQYKRLIKDHGAIVLFGSQPFFSDLIHSNKTMFREELVWLKNRSGSGFHSNSNHIKIHENIAVFSKQSRVFNPQKWGVEEEKFLTKRKTFDKYEEANNNIYGGMKKTRKPDIGERNPISVIPFSVCCTPAKSKTYAHEIDLRLHPTQKPVALFEYLIKTYTNEGDLVLDNCIGSGTTAIAAINTKRNFIGIEKEQKYVDIANERISKVMI